MLSERKENLRDESNTWKKNKTKHVIYSFFPLKWQAILDAVRSHHWSWIKVQNSNAIKIKQVQNISSQKLHFKSKF